MRASIIILLLAVSCAHNPNSDADHCVRWARQQHIKGIDYLERIDLYRGCMRDLGWSWEDNRWVRSD